MNAYQPTVDILLATHNGERYLQEQIESIRYQTYKEWRLLISDDCSSDNTLGIIKSYAKADPRITLVSESKRFGGAKENFFHLLHQSTGQLAMFCDQDDVWLDDKIEVTLRAMRRAEADTDTSIPVAIFTDSVVVDEDLRFLSYSFQRFDRCYPYQTNLRRLLASNAAPGNTMMVNRPLVRLLQSVEQPKRIIMHDWYAMLLASAFGTVVYIPTPTLLYRQHKNNTLGAISLNSLSKILHRMGPERDAERTARLKVEYESASQAAYFANRYATQLSEEQYEQAKAYVQAITTSRLSLAIFNLARSGCWRPGLTGKIGQILHRCEFRRYVSHPSELL